MRKINLLVLGLMLPVSVMAQMAFWDIQPKYDKMEMWLPEKILLTDSAGIATVWDAEGKRLYETEYTVNPYSEDRAVVTDNNKILGFVNQRGKFTQLPESYVAYDYPMYSDGFLCFKNNNGYGYFQANSDPSSFLLNEKAFPFSHGYATYMSFKQPEKRKDAYYNYHFAGDKSVSYTLGGKPFDYRDIDFLSSVAPDGRAVAVIKNKVYWFDSSKGEFSPMYGAGVEDKKNVITVDDKVAPVFESAKGKFHFNGKYGKNNIVKFSFDDMFRPDTIILDDRAITFPAPKVQEHEYKSPLTVISAGGKKGLNYDGKPLLPPQFDEVSVVYGDRALVKFNGKWGLLHANPGAKYSFEMNNGKDIGFRHRTFETQIRLDLPKEILSGEVDFDIAPGAGARLDKRFMDSRDTRAGNYLTYNVVLNIPEDLPSTITDLTYPIVITYNGLTLYEFPMVVKAWHLKSYNVNVDEGDMTVKDGKATFTVDIECQRTAAEDDYPFTVQAKSDELSINYEKLSETRHRFIVAGLAPGSNHLDIHVTEKGCPSAVFPMEITYVKPTARGREQIEVKRKPDFDDDPYAVPAEDAGAAPTATAPVAAPQPAATEPSQAPANAVVPQTMQPTEPLAAPQNAGAQPQTQSEQPDSVAKRMDAIKDSNLLRFLN